MIVKLLLGISLLPLINEAFPPVFCTTMLMSLHVLINHEYLASAQSSSNLVNSTFLSLFFKVVTRNFNVSRDGLLFFDRKTNYYEVE